MIKTLSIKAFRYIPRLLILETNFKVFIQRKDINPQPLFGVKVLTLPFITHQLF